MPLAEFFREIANRELECDVIGFDGEARRPIAIILLKARFSHFEDVSGVTIPQDKVRKLVPSGMVAHELLHTGQNLVTEGVRVVVISVPLQGHVLHCKGCCGLVLFSYRKTVQERLQPQPFTVLLIS